MYPVAALSVRDLQPVLAGVRIGTCGDTYAKSAIRDDSFQAACLDQLIIGLLTQATCERTTPVLSDWRHDTGGATLSANDLFEKFGEDITHYCDVQEIHEINVHVQVDFATGCCKGLQMIDDSATARI